MRNVWSAQSRDDLRAIRTHIARDSDQAATRVVQKLRAAVAQLKTFPRFGSVVEAWGRDDVRELLVGNYRIIYHVTDAETRIITIIHAARSLPAQPDL